jgi:hypothetical protein
MAQAMQRHDMLKYIIWHRSDCDVFEYAATINGALNIVHALGCANCMKLK